MNDHHSIDMLRIVHRSYNKFSSLPSRIVNMLQKFQLFSAELGCTEQQQQTDRQTDRHPFNGHFSRILWVNRYQKVKPIWILMKHDTMEWQWHQIDHMQMICTSLETDNRVNHNHIIQFFYRPDALLDAQPTVSKQQPLIQLNTWQLNKTNVYCSGM